MLRASGYTVPKPKGPVCDDIKTSSGSSPHRKAGLCHAYFLGLVRLHRPIMVSGGMGLPVRMAARLLACHQHPVHLLRVMTQTVVFLGSPAGITMTATQGRTAPAQSTPDTIPTTNLTAVLAAFNAANLASSYIERGNFTAARRKLVQALASVNQLAGV